MITSVVANMTRKHLKNIVKTGSALILSNLVQAELRRCSNDTIEEVAKDLRRARNGIRERREESIAS